MRHRPLELGIALALLAAGCGGGGGTSGTAPTARSTFVVPHVLESSGHVKRVAVGDVNGDGVPDLMVLDDASASVQALLSTALRESPTLSSTGVVRPFVRGPAAYEAGARAFVWSTASDLCIADVDGDGRPDLVVAGGSAGQVGVWASDLTPAGALRYHEWRWPSIVSVTGSADRVAVGDVNGDGRCDLVTLDESTGQAHVLLQTTTPLTFTVGNDPPAVGACHGLVLADFDRDGRLDILTNRPSADAIDLVLNGGAAGWTIRESPTKASTGKSMAVGDVDGDGWNDVVVLGEGGTFAMCLHQNPAQPGTFDSTASALGFVVREDGLPASQITIDEPGSPRAGLAVHDVGDNGVPDNGIAFRRKARRPCRTVCQDGMCLADVDRDGVLDLVCSPDAADPDQTPIVCYGLRESPTRFSLGRSEHLSTRFRESPSRPSMGRLCALVDLDSDGKLDVITGDPDFDLLSLRYTEPGVPPPPPAYAERVRESPTRRSSACRIADLDRDGHPDLVTATDTGLEVRWQDPASPGSFLAPIVLFQGAFVDVAVGDVNGDGCPDLVVCAPAFLAVLPRDPTKPRSFLPATVIPNALPGNLEAIALGDVTGDGLLDCVAVRESPSKASLARGKIGSFFDVFVEFPTAVNDPRGVAVADLDGDGRLDVVICGTDQTSVVLQNPAAPGTWKAPEVLPLARGVHVATGDVNGDGRCDVVVAGAQGVTVALQSAVTDGRFLPAYALSSVACGGLALGDFDRDGIPDVCFVEAATGTQVVVHGDPDFDLLRVLSLNGLPPGVPYEGIWVAAGDVDGDGKADLVTGCPTAPGAANGLLSLVENR